MGSWSVQILWAISVIVGFVGCTKFGSPLATQGNISVLLPVMNSSVVRDSSSTLPYEFKVVQLNQIFEFKRMNGAFAQFFLNPGLDKTNHLMGQRPQTQFFNSRSGYYVAADSSSLELASIYYHLQNMAQLDSDLGYKNLNKWPRDVGVGAEIRWDENTRFENNAIYDAQLDALLIVPYVADQLPLSVNAGVLAHEHFHSLFYKLLTKELIDKKLLNMGSSAISHSRAFLKGSFPGLLDEAQVTTPEVADLDLYQMTFLKSFNEGFADFWGWMYTRDDNFILSSLRKQKEGDEDPAERNLNLKEGEPLVIPDAADFFKPVEQALSVSQGKPEVETFVSQYAYRNGTLFAKSAKKLTLILQSARSISGPEAQKEIAKSLLKSLENLKAKMVAAQGKEKVSPSWVVQELVGQISKLSLAECQKISEAIHFTDSSQSIADQKSQCVENQGKVVMQ